MTKFDKDTGNVLLLKPVGRNPYTYSDATGIAARTVTDPTGIWTVIGDGGAPDTIWDKVSWNTEPEGQVPTGANITVSVRAANTSPELALLPFTPVTNGTNNLAISGRFIDVRTVLRPNDQNESPILSDLVLNTLEDALSCDLDNNNEVNILDINLFRPHRNTPAGPNEPLDIDRNGVINKLDARKCVLECTNSRCAVSS